MEHLWQDLTFGMRSLLRRPGFTFLAGLTLAIGIGANTAIFSIVYAVVLRPLPYPEPDDLAYIGRDRDGLMAALSVPEVVALRREATVFGAVGSWDEISLNLVAGEQPEQLAAARITANLLPLLGVEPLIGRGFTADEERPGNDTVVLVRERFWKRRLGGAQEPVGRTLQLNGRSHTVVGVLADDFAFPSPDVALWVPMAVSQDEMDNPAAHSQLAIGRLGEEGSLAAAEAEASAIMARTIDGFQAAHRNRHGAIVQPMHEAEIEDHRAGLLLLLAAVGFLLLTACANVANLILARAAERQRELAIRCALGAGRSRLIRQLLTECLTLALAGGVAGFVLAQWVIDLVIRLSPAGISRIETAAVDWTAFVFALAVSSLTGLVFGLIPALKVSRVDLNRTLETVSRGSAPAHHRDGARSLLVAAEVALALVLLLGAGLAGRSFAELMRVDPGFDRQQVVSMRLLLPEIRYPEPSQQADFVQRLREEIGTVPGITASGLVSPLPLSGSTWRISAEVAGREAGPGEEVTSAYWRIVTPGYFRTMGIPLRRGRAFEERDMRPPEGGVDGEGGRSVAVVNESFVRRHFPGEEPLGRMVRVGYNEIECEIIGVVGDVHHKTLTSDAGEEMYTIFAATPWPRFDLAVRADGAPAAVVAAIREAVLRVDPEQPLYNVNTMPALIQASMAPQRFLMALMTAFAAIALILAVSGIYGVISYSVAQRRREIGIRMALGARPGEVLGLVLGQASRLILSGAAFGVVLALALSRFLASQLYGIEPTDPLTYGAVAALLIAVAYAATFVPARRATRVDPVIALRQT